MISKSSITLQNLGKITQCAPAVGAKMWCFLFVTLGLPAHGGYSLNKYCVMIYGSILILFSPFFRNDCPFRCIIECLFPLPGGATIFEKLRTKIAKTLKKMAEKFVRTTSYR